MGVVHVAEGRALGIETGGKQRSLEERGVIAKNRLQRRQWRENRLE